MLGRRNEVDVEAILRQREIERRLLPTAGEQASSPTGTRTAPPLQTREFHADEKRFALRIPLQLQTSQRLRDEVDAFIGNKLSTSPDEPRDAFTLSFLFKHRAGDRASVQLLLSWLQSRLRRGLHLSDDFASPLEAGYKCALFLAHELSVGCYERGVLFAQIWNFYTEALDAELLQTRSSLASASQRVHELELKSSRLESKMDWVHETREELETLSTENAQLRQALFLAETERDFLLRRRSEDPTAKAQVRHRRAQAHWDRARRLTQTNELMKQLRKDVKQLAACVNFARDSARRLGQELQLSPCDAEKLQSGLASISQVCENAVDVHHAFQNKAMNHGDLAEGFMKAFSSRAEEKGGILEALMRGAGRGVGGSDGRIVKYLSPQENEIAAEIQAACGATCSHTTEPVTNKDTSDPSLAVLRSKEVFSESALDERTQTDPIEEADADEEVSHSLVPAAAPENTRDEATGSSEESLGQPTEKLDASTTDAGVESESVEARNAEAAEAWRQRCEALEAQVEALSAEVACRQPPQLPEAPVSTELSPTTSTANDRGSQTGGVDACLSPLASPRPTKSRKSRPARTLQGVGRSATVKKRSGECVERRLSLDSDGEGAESSERLQHQTREPFADGLLIPTDQRLLDVVKKHGNARVRSKEWLLRFIDELYRAKRQNDEQRVQSGARVQSLAEFMFKHLNGYYGTKTLVNEYSASVVATVNRFHRHDVRVEIFGHFLSEYWDAATLTVFLRGFEKLLEPSRIPCLELPADYHKKGEPAVVDVVKCSDVAEGILGPNTADVREAFRSALLEKSSAVTEEETVMRFFQAPGAEFKEALSLKAAALAQGGCSVLPDIVFLALLCKEHIRCERVFLDALPRIFKDTDTNHDGTLSKDEISEMLQRLHDPTTTTSSAELDASVEEFWEDCVFAQRLQSKGVPWRRKKDSAEDRTADSEQPIGLQAFSEAAAKSAILRSYVRQHCTPPPSKAASAADAENASLYLLAVVDRHWRFNQAAVMKCICLSGNRESILRELVSKLSLEIQGARKADLYHSILRLLCEEFLQQLQQRLSESGVREGAADLNIQLGRAVDAVRVMYGTRYLVEENLLEKGPLASPSVVDKSALERGFWKEAGRHVGRCSSDAFRRLLKCTMD